ncbi:MAG: 7-cyano-7-deazaguanine synthase QueC [Deltaproteobacteria bacterium RIFCSPLOWO2_02_FULL_53_8]|nr:MAG: 7-cyano-7-deazaguanine synthase QueC [Deltaproteobacteria bacterium RIFCSPLOWO2_02_FULL_53_8]
MIDSVVLVSGGMDSAVTAAVAAAKGACAFLHVNYGQRTEGRELAAFTAIADFYRVKTRLVADIGYLKAIGGSALTDKRIKVPIGRLLKKGVPITYVPFRNAHLLSIAVSWAEVVGARNIYIGAVEEDSSGYPDCCAAFFNAFEKMVALGTAFKPRIRIKTPLIALRKSQIIRKGARFGAPLHLTWSCYKESKAACGECDSCLLRLRGFKEAGVVDPIQYRR